MSSMTCKHNDELVALGAMSLLSDEEQTRLDERVSTCPACRKRLQEYRALVALMPRLAMPEMTPSRAITAKTPPRLNGKTPHISLLFGARQGTEELATSDGVEPEEPVTSQPKPYSFGQRLVSIISGLAAVVMLAGLIGGFWLLLLGRAPGGSYTVITVETPQSTTIISNPCGKGASGNQGPACGLVLLDNLTVPAQLVEADPLTGQPLPELQPLPIGNAGLASLSADHHTLVLGVLPYQPPGPTFLQIVLLKTWRLGAKLQVQLDQGTSLQNLAITPDGNGVYAVIVSSSQSASPRAILRYYAYDRGRDTLASRWTAQLPFAPGDANSFALSPDGKTAYLFSAQTSTPQIAAIPLGANGMGSPAIKLLPFIAPEGVLPSASDTAYKPGDPIPTFYQPAVMFAPAQNTLYMVHADAAQPTRDILTLIDLTRLNWRDFPIPPQTGQMLANINGAPPAGGPLFLPSLASSQSLAASASSTSPVIQPLQATRPAKGTPFTGRSEQGAISPDGRWVYLTGTSYAPASNQVEEQVTGLGLLKINAQTGQVVGRWLTGNAYSLLTISPDGGTLYMFGNPVTSLNNPNVSNLLAFDPQQGKLVSSFDTIPSSPFLFALS